jgi:putative SOS response-associated peptidase YedK
LLALCVLYSFSQCLFGSLAMRTTPGRSSSIRHEAAPAESQLVYRRDPVTGLPVEGHLKWGLVPHYADRWPDLRPIHARAETIAEQRMFRDAFRKRRCITPMNAFFQKDKTGKRYAVSRGDGQPFGVAGIWENWKNPETSQWERTFALITVPANTLIAPVHDRMLAIIEQEDFERWFAPEDDDPRYLLKPYPAELMSIAPIGKTARRL